MDFKILSHASILIRSGATSIIVDPWLIGSCYWRSWWNFPEPSFSEEEIAGVDAVIISHLHWDHWHGPTLRKFFKHKKIIIPDEPGVRSERDLRAIGFKDVRRVGHGEAVDIGNLRVTLYQFGRFLNDAAVVVEDDGTVLLNANDAKIAGSPLRDIIRRHGRIDFAFRSHSSANPRVCFSLTEGGGFVADDREHYFRAFVAFMDAVNPRYAIPFASNHCHLHSDVFDLNTYISNPIELREYCLRVNRRHWEIQVMLPGSSWSSVDNFKLSDESMFKDLKASLGAYREQAATTLLMYAEAAERLVISDAVLDRFSRMFIVFGRPKGCSGRFNLTLVWPSGRARSFLFRVGSQDFEKLDDERSPVRGCPVIKMPVEVFRDAVLKNMFHHAWISKRCRFIAADEIDLRRLAAIVGFLEYVELGVYPVRWGYIARLLRAYVKRWREVGVYMHALWLLKVKRKPIYLVEEAILKGEF
jgi:UDP-MurNAc hydroxylase